MQPVIVEHGKSKIETDGGVWGHHWGRWQMRDSD